jgi:hypothetical protein
MFTCSTFGPPSQSSSLAYEDSCGRSKGARATNRKGHVMQMAPRVENENRDSAGQFLADKLFIPAELFARKPTAHSPTMEWDLERDLERDLRLFRSRATPQTLISVIEEPPPILPPFLRPSSAPQPWRLSLGCRLANKVGPWYVHLARRMRPPLQSRAHCICPAGRFSLSLSLSLSLFLSLSLSPLVVSRLSPRSAGRGASGTTVNRSEPWRVSRTGDFFSRRAALAVLLGPHFALKRINRELLDYSRCRPPPRILGPPVTCTFSRHSEYNVQCLAL